MKYARLKIQYAIQNNRVFQRGLKKRSFNEK